MWGMSPVQVRQTAVSLDGDIIVSSCEDGTVWRWDATAGGSGTSASLGGRAATPSLGLSNGGGRVSQQVSGPGSNGYGRVSTPDTSTGRMQQQQKQQQQQQQHKRRKQQTADGNDTEDNTGDNDGVQEQQQQQQLGRQPAVADQDDEVCLTVTVMYCSVLMACAVELWCICFLAGWRWQA